MNRNFEEARSLLEAGDLERAETAILKGLKLAPTSVEGHNLWGIIHTLRKDYDKAVAAFREALRIQPNSTVARNNLGKVFLEGGKLDLAAKEFLFVLRLVPRHRDANYNLGLVLLGQGRPLEAITHFRRVHPPDMNTLLNLTRAYFRAGQTTQALDLARQVSRQDESDPRLHFSLGLLLASEKQYDLAQYEFELADVLLPGSFEILHNLGQTCIRNRHYEKADASLQRALAAKPDSAETMVLLAQAYTARRKEMSALELLVRARKLAPGNTDVLLLTARIFMSLSLYEDAIQLLVEAAGLAPQRPDIHAALGESYLASGKTDKALKEFEILLALDPSSRSYALLGASYRHLGRFDEAKQQVLKGLEINPSDVVCLYNLAYVENKRANVDEAEKVLQRALQTDPNHADSLCEMGSVKMTRREFKDAIPFLRRCTATSSRPAPAYYRLAMAERRVGLREEAEKDLKIFQTLSKDPGEAPYPYQRFFDYLDQRASLPREVKAEITLQELLEQAKRNPDQPRTLFLLAEAFLRSGQPEEASKVIAQLNHISKGDYRTALGVGVLLARYRMYPEAIEQFRMALKSDPGSDDAKYNLANVYFQLRDYVNALTYMEQLSPEGQTDPAFFALRGDIHGRLGRTSDAVTLFEEAVKRAPDNEDYYFQLALTQLRAGSFNDAEESLRRGLARVPNSANLWWGMSVVSVTQGRVVEAEEHLTKCTELAPEWPIAYATLGVLYYATGRFSKVRETLNRYKELYPEGGLNVRRIDQILSQSPAVDRQPEQLDALPLESRREFLRLALTFAEHEP